MRVKQVAFFGILSLLFAPPVHLSRPAQAQIRSGEEQQFLSQLARLEDSLKARRVFLTPPPNTSLTGYVEVVDGHIAYTYKSPKVFKIRSAEPVLRFTLDGDMRKVRARLQTERTGWIQLEITPATNSRLTRETVLRALEDCVQFEEGEATRPRLVASTTSKTAHARNCNHLPPLQERSGFRTSEEAASQGYRLCPLCFMEPPSIPDLALELVLSRAGEAALLQTADLSEDEALVARLRAAGERVLAGWPVPLRGYSYRFRVLEDEDLNACALPAGRVFVTSALLGAVESELELEALLAHEIAHVERRHGLQKLRVALASQEATMFVAALLGAAATTVDPTGSGTGQAMVQLAELVTRVAGSIAVIGHGRANEEEADAYAVAVVERSSGQRGREALIRVMDKLRYTQTFMGTDGLGSSVLSTHPFIDDRRAKLVRTEIRRFPKELRFEGRDKSGQPRVALVIALQAYADYPVAPLPGSLLPPSRRRELRLFGWAEGLDDLRPGTVLNAITLELDGKQFVLDNAEDTELSPGETVGFSVRLENAAGLLDDRVELGSCEIPGVVSWERTGR